MIEYQEQTQEWRHRMPHLYPINPVEEDGISFLPELGERDIDVVPPILSQQPLIKTSTEDAPRQGARHPILSHHQIQLLYERGLTSNPIFLIHNEEFFKGIDGELSQAFTDLCYGSNTVEELIFRCNRGLVHFVIKGILTSKNLSPELRLRVENEDLYQEGYCALVNAIQGFNINKGYRLSTYAWWAISHAVHKNIFQSTNSLNLDYRTYHLIYYIKSLGNTLEKEEIYNLLVSEGYSPNNISRIIELALLPSTQPLSFDELQNILEPEITKAKDEESSSIDDNCLNREYAETISFIILKYIKNGYLTKNQGIVLQLLLLEGKRQSEIAQILGVTRQRIHIIKEQALEKLNLCEDFYLFFYGISDSEIEERDPQNVQDYIHEMKQDFYDYFTMNSITPEFIEYILEEVVKVVFKKGYKNRKKSNLQKESALSILRNPCRDKTYSKAKQIATLFLSFCQLNTVVIAKILDRDHTTVSHNYIAIENHLLKDNLLAMEVREIGDRIVGKIIADEQT